MILKKNLKDAIDVEIISNEIILDLDTIEDYGNIKNMYRINVRHKELFNLMHMLDLDEIPYAIATVIKVFGSSSGKVGDKAIFDQNGKRLRVHRWNVLKTEFRNS